MISCFGGMFNLPLGNLSDFHKPPSPRTPLVARGALWGLQEVQSPPVLTEGFIGSIFTLGFPLEQLSFLLLSSK